MAFSAILTHLNHFQQEKRSCSFYKTESYLKDLGLQQHNLSWALKSWGRSLDALCDQYLDVTFLQKSTCLKTKKASHCLSANLRQVNDFLSFQKGFFLQQVYR